MDEFVLSIAVFPSLRGRARMNGEEDEAKIVAELCNITAQREVTVEAHPRPTANQVALADPPQSS